MRLAGLVPCSSRYGSHGHREPGSRRRIGSPVRTLKCEPVGILRREKPRSYSDIASLVERPRLTTRRSGWDQRLLGRLHAEYLEMPGMKLRIRTGTTFVRDRADDVQTGPGRAREGELSLPEVQRTRRASDLRCRRGAGTPASTRPATSRARDSLGRHFVPRGTNGDCHRLGSAVVAVMGKSGSPSPRLPSATSSSARSANANRGP